MIAIDWGTSNFRAYRLGRQGEVLERRSFPCGVLRIEEGRFPEVLRSNVSDWLAAGEDRILLCGMVGSRQGWAEVQYVSCPAGVDDLAKSVCEVPFDGACVFLVPGVMAKDSFGAPEVMRGEETEAMGALKDYGNSGIVCLPGTHSKWIELRDGAIVNFVTFMTGEIYGALRKHTILARNMMAGAPIDNEAFLRGVERSSNSGGLLHHLFSVRTLGLVEELKDKAAESYLSGVLIGHEVRNVFPGAMSRTTNHGHEIHLVGAAHLCRLYNQAIQACGGRATVEDQDAAARGLAAIGRRLSWL